MEKQSIGIFDSGFGGLTALNAIRALLPNESISYFADTANLPYGEKSPEKILKYSHQSAEFLQSQGIKLLVLACHSSASTSLHKLKRSFSFPVVSITDASIQALASLKDPKHLAILGTRATIDSGFYQTSIEEIFPSTKVSALACPLFVPLIEKGLITNKLLTQTTIEKSLRSLKADQDPIDKMLLACTHFPLIQSQIEKELGLEDKVINPSHFLAKEVKKLLIQNNLEAKGTSPKLDFFVSSKPETFEETGSLFSPHITQPICALCPQ